MGFIGRLVQVLTGLLNNTATRVFLLKMFIKMAIVGVVPFVVFMAFNEVFKTFVEFQVQAVNDVNVSSGGTVLQLAGLGAYLYNELGLNVGVSMIVSAYGIVLMLRSIPFLR